MGGQENADLKVGATKGQKAAALQSGLGLHNDWVWDTGLLQHINRNPATFAVDLESRKTPQEPVKW
jgi:hypothetical protein